MAIYAEKFPEVIPHLAKHAAEAMPDQCIDLSKFVVFIYRRSKLKWE
jgi:hypothetical protein